MEIILKNVRTAFSNIYSPKAMANDANSKPAYGSKLIIEPDSENDKIIQAAMLKVAEEKWPGKGKATLDKLIADKKTCYQMSEYQNKDGEAYDGFEGNYSLSTRSEKLKPTVKNRFNADVTEGDQGAPYPGCYVHAAVDIWPQDNQFGRRINGTLQGVMFAGDGAAFSGARPANDGTFANMAAEPTTADLV